LYYFEGLIEDYPFHSYNGSSLGIIQTSLQSNQSVIDLLQKVLPVIEQYIKLASTRHHLKDLLF